MLYMLDVLYCDRYWPPVLEGAIEFISDQACAIKPAVVLLR